MPRKEIQDKWRKPKPSLFKVNIDFACEVGNNLFGINLVIREE